MFCAQKPQIVERVNHEAIYPNMPVFGLAQTTEHVRVVGGRETARRRLTRENRG